MGTSAGKKGPGTREIWIRKERRRRMGEPEGYQ